jgi:hypothetical protein
MVRAVRCLFKCRRCSRRCFLLQGTTASWAGVLVLRGVDYVLVMLGQVNQAARFRLCLRGMMMGWTVPGSVDTR